jgi:hypothetical protein
MSWSRELKLLCSLLLCAVESQLAKEEIKLEGADPPKVRYDEEDEKEDLEADSDNELNIPAQNIISDEQKELCGKRKLVKRRRVPTENGKKRKKKGLSRHMASSHQFSYAENSVRCTFDGCDFSLSAADSSLQAQLRQHETTHSCPICRNVHSSRESIR